MEDEPAEGQEAQGPHIIIGQDQMAGVWANFARVSHTEHEFTLDFVRLDSTMQPPSGIVVARVSVSPLFITQLVKALDTNWELFARKALPKEVYEDATEDDSGSAGDGTD